MEQLMKENEITYQELYEYQEDLNNNIILKKIKTHK